MKIAKFVCFGLVVALTAACGSEAEDSGSTAMIAQDIATASGDTINLDDYGFIGGTQLTPVSMPGWFPQSITLPDDFVTYEARQMGTSAAIVRGLTNEPADSLFDSLSAALREQGFEVRDGEGYRADNLVYFAGNGYEDSTIRIRPGPTDTMLDIGLVSAP